MKKLKLADRMKEYYENRFRTYLPRRTYTIIRIDGKAFHTYTKGLIKPFDDKFMQAMDLTTIFLCQQIQGAKAAYVQSDEISILITDFDNIDTQAWFNNNLQKMCSVSASLATAKFNELHDFNKLAFFDSRVFQISHVNEVGNYFKWRQQDCVRNSVQSTALSYYSHKELLGKNTTDLIELLGPCYESYDNYYKFGRLIVKNKDDNRWNVTKAPMFTSETFEQLWDKE